jgi:hypothetical protein
MLRISARGQLDAVEPAVIDQRSCLPQANPVQPFDDEHVLAAQLVIKRRERHRYAAPDGSLLGRPARGHGGHVACLNPEVELLPHGRGESLGQGYQAVCARPAGAALELGRNAQHDVQVLFDGGPDTRALDLHRDLGVRAVAAAQPGLVHLGDRCGRGRHRVQLRENLRSGYPERLGYHLLYLLPSRWFDPVLELAELGDEFLGEEIAAGGQQLAQLGEGHPALF